ncbi:MAG TPA: cation-translocating P-type ATPase [Methanotrichaceae archaeon]|nr:cation-translocating P-type ATPase [Methanotrichaceae archaeon]HQF17142.1 cation-translocating P-type ATPase [Methanotrichaceae archaeon]HQI91542.1 cation-translocating P-type ATPase [Methanotrichaceae archaeon]
MSIDDREDSLSAAAFNTIHWLSRYRQFLLDPGTIVTVVGSLILTLAVVIDPGGLYHGETHEGGSVLYLIAALVGSSFIWMSALRGIRERDFTADIPVSIATMAAIAIGEYSAAAVVAVLLLLGGLLEEFVAARANQSLVSLAGLLPDKVTVRRNGGDLVVCLEDVDVGDLVLVRSGDRIAVDGEVVSGSASVNQAAITGESLAVEKKPGDQVYAGTLSEVGALEIRVSKIGGDTALGHIRSLIEEAQSHKPPIERLLNRYAKIYMPLALISGGLLWLWSGDVMRAITMLIVFCPCVIVLATPTALVAAIGNAAARGSLVKKGETIEVLSEVDTVVFDKTGTLTSGKPRLLHIIATGNMTEETLLKRAAIAEKFSEHPFGRALVSAALGKEETLQDPEFFEALPGQGIRARAEGEEVILGRPNVLKKQGIAVPPEIEDSAGSLEESGCSVVLAGIGGRAEGLFAFEDELRLESSPVVRRLGDLGLNVAIVSGDNHAATQRVALSIGVKNLFSEKMPHEKVDIVKALQSEGHKVAFVGEGVNDGPALAQADVGIAMGISGTDVAMQTADIGLLSDDLSKMPHLIMVSRKAIATIKHNLIFSLGVLAIAVALTIPGILTPVTGAMLHELSSVPVIVNSMRLIAYSPNT